MARGNPQWRDFDPQVEALAIFLGPEACLAELVRHQTREGRPLPTWNYLTVHAYGQLRTFDDPERLRAHVTRLTDRQEAHRDDRWRVSDAPDDFVDGMLKGIVGLELHIARLEGKWKMSQNRPAADQRGAIDGLEATGRAAEQAVADVMRARSAQ